MYYYPFLRDHFQVLMETSIMTFFKKKQKTIQNYKMKKSKKCVNITKYKKDRKKELN